MIEMNWKIVLFLALFAFTVPYICKGYSAPIEMESQQSATLYWGDKASFRNYTIEAADFTVSGEIKSVKLKLYKDGVYLDERIMNVNYPRNHWNYNGEDEIWIDVSNVYIEPPQKAYVDLYVTLRGLPELAIEVTTDADSYKANRYIQVTVKVKNTGSDSPSSCKGARVGDVKLNIDTAGMQVVMGETSKSYSEIKRGEQVPDIKLTLNAPSLLNKTTLYINVTATGYDAKNISYAWNGSKAIEIESMIEIIKLVSGSAGYLTPTPTETGIYMDESSGVSVVIRNHGSFPVYEITINDSLLSEFKLKSGQTNMKIDILEPGVEKERTPFYIMIPLKPGSYTLPKATANFTYNGINYTVESEAPTLVVHGPYIELTKIADSTVVKNGDRINVTVTAKNSGDRTCAVNISDEIPVESARLVNGSLTSNTIVLKAGESTSLSYEIEIITNRSFTLPQATSTYVDVKNYRAIAKSSIVAITNLNESLTPTPTGLPTQTPTPEPTPTRRVAPGFEGAAITAIAALVYVLKRKGKK